MAAKNYRNFDLLIEAADAGSFRARVTSCPIEESPSAKFTLPFDGTQLENLMLKLDPGRSGTRRAGADPQSQAAMDLGGPLFESVFSEDLMLAWSRSQDVTRAAGEGLRLRLRLTDAPAIAGLPWELLYDRRTNGYIAQSERTPIVRYLEVSQPPRPLSVDGALRVLVIISSPTDLPELDVDEEWRRVQDAMQAKVDQGTVVIDRLPAPTIGALSSWLRKNDVHILHFIGHGDYDKSIEDGVLYFCDKYGRSAKVSPSVLGPFLHDHDPLRLVLLNACQSARVDAKDPFSGMAQGLVQQDVTAVVAMQFPISDGAAVTFTGEFYGAVADGIPVDQAATWARKGLLADYPNEWATPVLFLRAPDGRVFDHIVAQPPLAAVPVTTEPTADPIAEPDTDPVVPAVASNDNEHEAADALAPEPAAPVTDPALTPVAPEATSAPPDRLRPEPSDEPDRGPAVTGYAIYDTYATTPATTPASLYASSPRPSQPPPPTYRLQQPPPRAHRGRISAVAATVIIVVVSAVGYLAWNRYRHPNGGGGTVSVSTLSGPTFQAVHLTTPPALDGKGNDWPANTPTVDSDQLVAGDSQVVKGTWALGWNQSHLYLFVDVTDPQLTQTHKGEPSLLFRGDGVSFEFGTAVPKNANKTLEVGDEHVLIGPSSGGSLISAINVASGAVFSKGRDSIQGLEGVAVGTDHGYVIEARIPWPTLGLTNPSAGVEVGMNLNVSNANAGGANIGTLHDMVSNNPARHNNDASLRSQWGTVTLEG